MVLDCEGKEGPGRIEEEREPLPETAVLVPLPLFPGGSSRAPRKRRREEGKEWKKGRKKFSLHLLSLPPFADAVGGQQNPVGAVFVIVCYLSFFLSRAGAGVSVRVMRFCYWFCYNAPPPTRTRMR